jgi:hypothetical protein
MKKFRNLDKRIRQLCGDRNLYDLVDEIKRFREQCLRVQCVDLSKKSVPIPASENGIGEVGEEGQLKRKESSALMEGAKENNKEGA